MNSFDDPFRDICLNCPDDDCPDGECGRVKDKEARKIYYQKMYQENKAVYKYRQKTNWQNWISRPENQERRKKYLADRAVKKRLGSNHE